mmetsp:Transcript_38030/g.75402  ORF Transcript_38030/g.75402 Transcript_38030/m.75402 type:complete len:109 (-) Transcript_38030:81-407(-)
MGPQALLPAAVLGIRNGFRRLEGSLPAQHHEMQPGNVSQQHIGPSAAGTYPSVVATLNDGSPARRLRQPRERKLMACRARKYGTPHHSVQAVQNCQMQKRDYLLTTCN